MDATITNLSSEPVFVPGPNLELAATGDPDGNDAKVWPGVTVADLDGNARIKTMVVGGTLTVTMSDDPEDLAASTAGNMSTHMLPTYAVASLPTGVDGRVAFASDGRAGAEGAAAGTGVLVVYSNGDWRRQEDMAVVAA